MGFWKLYLCLWQKPGGPGLNLSQNLYFPCLMCKIFRDFLSFLWIKQWLTWVFPPLNFKEHTTRTDFSTSPCSRCTFSDNTTYLTTSGRGQYLITVAVIVPLQFSSFCWFYYVFRQKRTWIEDLNFANGMVKIMILILMKVERLIPSFQTSLPIWGNDYILFWSWI